MTSTANVLADVVAERKRQDDKWGPDTGPSFNVDPRAFVTAAAPYQAVAFAAYRHGIIGEQAAKNVCDTAFRLGRGSWAHILIEEVAEAFSAAVGYDYAKHCATELAWDDQLAALRSELVQVAAVAVKWVEHLDRQTQLNSEAQQ